MLKKAVARTACCSGPGITLMPLKHLGALPTPLERSSSMRCSPHQSLKEVACEATPSRWRATMTRKTHIILKGEDGTCCRWR
eukprot:14785207-Alexandrium_andersonii.AAC.1